MSFLKVLFIIGGKLISFGPNQDLFRRDTISVFNNGRNRSNKMYVSSLEYIVSYEVLISLANRLLRSCHPFKY